MCFAATLKEAALLPRFIEHAGRFPGAGVRPRLRSRAVRGRGAAAGRSGAAGRLRPRGQGAGARQGGGLRPGRRARHPPLGARRQRPGGGRGAGRGRPAPGRQRRSAQGPAPPRSGGSPAAGSPNCAASRWSRRFAALRALRRRTPTWWSWGRRSRPFCWRGNRCCCSRRPATRWCPGGPARGSGSGIIDPGPAPAPAMARGAQGQDDPRRQGVRCRAESGYDWGVGLSSGRQSQPKTALPR